MPSVDCFKPWCYYAVILAVTLQFYYFHRHKDETIPPDAESAISRAKTDSCKNELRDFALRLSTDKLLNGDLHLKRTCLDDSQKQIQLKSGCISSSTPGLIGLDESVSNLTACLNLCYSFGHTYGGFSASSKTKGCFCGDNDVARFDIAFGDCVHDQFEWYRVKVSQHIGGKIFEHSNPGKNKVKIAFLLSLNGRSILQIRRLLKRIYSTEHIYYVHVDSREQYLFRELVKLEQKHDNIIIARNRFKTIWGGSTLLSMMLSAMGNLARYPYDYIINLSESDFPLKGIGDLASYLSANYGAIFLRVHNMSGYNFIKKQGLNWNFYQCEDRNWRIAKRLLPTGIFYTGGSDWFALPKDFCVFIRDQMSNKDGLVYPLLQLFNHTLLPAESFFHTLALNSEFCDRFVNNNLRLTNWQRKQGCKCQHKSVVDWCGCSPLVYREHDWNRLRLTNSSEDLFLSRKFDPTISASIINAVEKLVVDAGDKTLQDQPRPDDDKKNDTRYWLQIFTSDEFPQVSQMPRSLFNEFGLFVLGKISELFGSMPNNTFVLESVDVFFNEDRLKGYILQFCDTKTCLQTIVEKDVSAHVESYNKDCFSSKRRLNAIEVSHGFDVSERMFRDYKPLFHRSDIVIYHEWLTQNINSSSKNTTDRLEFVWMNPFGVEELTQHVKLRSSARMTRLFLAHRLSVQRPLISGLWTLSIVMNERVCLNYKFLVFNPVSFTRKAIEQKQFDKFYKISKICRLDKFENKMEFQLNDCNQTNWSLSAYKRKIQDYDL